MFFVISNILPILKEQLYTPPLISFIHDQQTPFLRFRKIKIEYIDNLSASLIATSGNELYIDRILENPGLGGVGINDECIFKVRIHSGYGR